MSVEAIKEQLQLINQEAEKPFPDAVYIDRRLEIARKAIRESMLELMVLVEQHLKYDKTIREDYTPPVLAFLPTPGGTYSTDGIMLDVVSACGNGPYVQLMLSPLPQVVGGGS